MVIDFRPLEGRHTGDKIATELEQVIGEWALGGGEFFGVTTDNAENNNRSVRLLAGVADDTPGSRPRDPPSCPCLGTSTTRTASAEIRLSDAHWTALHELRAILEPFDSITLDSPDVSLLCNDLSSRALSKLERHMGGVSEEAAIATFLDPRLKTATFRLRARGARTSVPIVVEAGGHARGARTLDLSEERVKALVRKRLPPYQIAASAAAEARLGGEVTSAKGVTGRGSEERGCRAQGG
ncbi:unnamed protein product [Closterium sp. Naga37s-1]|nr:unnamed protein product [Closterium sp. Naga37s-1]